jgi:hypothetical protein
MSPGLAPETPRQSLPLPIRYAFAAVPKRFRPPKHFNAHQDFFSMYSRSKPLPARHSCVAHHVQQLPFKKISSSLENAKHPSQMRVVGSSS